MTLQTLLASPLIANRYPTSHPHLRPPQVNVAYSLMDPSGRVRTSWHSCATSPRLLPSLQPLSLVSRSFLCPPTASFSMRIRVAQRATVIYRFFGVWHDSASPTSLPARIYPETATLPPTFPPSMSGLAVHWHTPSYAIPLVPRPLVLVITSLPNRTYTPLFN